MAPNLLNSFIKFPSGVSAVGGWVELDRVTLGTADPDLTVASLADKRYYMILGDLRFTSGNAGSAIRLNNDTGTSYAVRRNTGGSDNTNVNLSSSGGYVTDVRSQDNFNVSYLSNLAAEEKLWQNWNSVGLTAGAATVPLREDGVGKWTNTSDAVDEFDYHQWQSNNFGVGSEAVVLGWDPADVHTTNFWEELASVSSTSTINNISSGVFTPKKYLWVQAWTDTTVAANWAMRLGNTTLDSGSNYASRKSSNGATDTTNATDTSGRIDTSGGGFVGPMFLDAFIVNVSGNEKLVRWHAIWGNTAGAANAPNRAEGVFKWVNTSNQADILSVGTFNQTFTKSELRVWGSD